ncbi:MAG: ISKra4 family transposase [bacterium]
MLERLLGRKTSTEVAETEIRAALSRIGSLTLRTVMQSEVDRADAQRVTAEAMVRHGRRPIWVRSLWGDFQIVRAYYTAEAGGQGDAPSDSSLGLWQSYTPVMARTLSKLAAQLPFEAAAAMLHEMTAATVNGRQFHRLTAEVGTVARAWLDPQKAPADPSSIFYVSFDGVAVPMRKECLKGRRGRAPDGTAKTREIRLGCTFTQTKTDEHGNPVRDPASTTYLASLSSSHDFGHQMRAEARRRGMTANRRVVVLTDGALWCETLASVNFPGRTHILDFFHAAEHVGALALALLGEGKATTVQFRAWRRALRRGKAAVLIAEAQSMLGKAHDREAAERNIRYLEHNLERMRYADFRKQGLFIGSGVVEAGCKTVVAQRAKLSGMLWGEKGIDDILALRCLFLSRRLDRFWDDALARPHAA